MNVYRWNAIDDLRDYIYAIIVLLLQVLCEGDSLGLGAK